MLRKREGGKSATLTLEPQLAALSVLPVDYARQSVGRLPDKVRYCPLIA
jgi:hypothetical protein